MRLNQVSEAIMWLPGFAPNDDPVFTRGPSTQLRAPIIAAELGIIPAVVDSVQVAQEVESAKKVVWPLLTAEAIGAWGGKVAKFENNIAAINLLRQLEIEDRAPSNDERLVLQRYTGWGGLPAAFNNDQNDTAWVTRSKELKALLTTEEWESARDSTPNAHYTDLPIVDAIWSAVRHLGFSGGRIVDPCTGVGHFLGAMPTEIADQSTVTAIELDNLSSRLTKKLYGHFGAQVLNNGFEKTKLPDGYFDLAISNVPFGAYKVAEARHKPYRDWNIHNYFFARALDLVRAGGLVAFITSTSTMDSKRPSLPPCAGYRLMISPSIAESGVMTRCSKA